MAAFFQNGLLQHSHVRDDRLRVDIWKQRVHFLPDGHMFDAVIAENASQHAAARTVHRVSCELEIGLGNHVQVCKFTDRFDVRLLEIDFFDSQYVIVFRHGAGVQLIFHFLHDGRRSRAAELAFELDPIPVPRVVAGSDYHSACCVLLLNGKGNRRSWRVVAGQRNRNPGCANHFPCHMRSKFRSEASVIADDNALPGIFVLEDVGGDCTCDAANIVEGEVVGDHATPTIGSEFDLSCH